MARHQRALEELLAVSSRISGEPSDSEILRRVCTGIRDALDFSNVCAALACDPETGIVVPQAAAGWQLEELQAARAHHRRPGRAAARRDVPPRRLLPPHPRPGADASRERGRGKQDT